MSETIILMCFITTAYGVVYLWQIAAYDRTAGMCVTVVIFHTMIKVADKWRVRPAGVPGFTSEMPDSPGVNNINVYVSQIMS